MRRTIAIRLDPETRDRLELLAAATGCHQERLVEEAVRRFVDEELAILIARRQEAGEEESTPALPERWKIIV